MNAILVVISVLLLIVLFVFIGLYITQIEETYTQVDKCQNKTQECMVNNNTLTTKFNTCSKNEEKLNIENASVKTINDDLADKFDICTNDNKTLKKSNDTNLHKLDTAKKLYTENISKLKTTENLMNKCNQEYNTIKQQNAECNEHKMICGTKYKTCSESFATCDKLKKQMIEQLKLYDHNPKYDVYDGIINDVFPTRAQITNFIDMLNRDADRMQFKHHMQLALNAVRNHKKIDAKQKKEISITVSRNLENGILGFIDLVVCAKTHMEKIFFNATFIEFMEKFLGNVILNGMKIEHSDADIILNLKNKLLKKQIMLPLKLPLYFYSIGTIIRQPNKTLKTIRLEPIVCEIGIPLIKEILNDASMLSIFKNMPKQTMDKTKTEIIKMCTFMCTCAKTNNK